MGRIFTVELDGRVYRCRFCRTHLAVAEDLISRSFHCRRGKAYLFNYAVNIWVGDEEERMLLSGMHTVADIFCCCCGQNVGWKYVGTESLFKGLEQKKRAKSTKEGKYVLERGRIVDGTELELDINSRWSGTDTDADDSRL